MINEKNENNTHSSSLRLDLPDQVLCLLRDVNLEPTDLARVRMARHLDLLRTWNRYASLISVGDLEHMLERHLVDSLSLAPYAASCTGIMLDVGSGGGFPAIPLKCLLPKLDLVLIERSAKKIGFLRKLTGVLGLESIRLIQGVFPTDLPDDLRTGVLTARAVERADELARDIAEWLPKDCAFLCQSGKGSSFGSMFHVELVDDDWGRLGHRRGSLEIIRRRE